MPNIKLRKERKKKGMEEVRERGGVEKEKGRQKKDYHFFTEK